MLGWKAVEDTDWDHLFHAYGIAEDTEEKLLGLTSEDETARYEGVRHLYAAVLHQGTIYSVTPIAVRIVAGILDEPVLRKPCRKEQSAGQESTASTLQVLVSFLGDVGKSLAWGEIPADVYCPSDEELDNLFCHLEDDDDGEDDQGWGSPLIGILIGQAVRDLCAMASEVQSAIVAFLSDCDPSVRQEAAYAVATWAKQQPPEEREAAIGTVTGQMDRSVG